MTASHAESRVFSSLGLYRGRHGRAPSRRSAPRSISSTSRVVVTDKQGAPITGLTADDFEVKEAGKPQAIKFFAAGDPDTAPPLHIGFLLDTSGSMEEDIKDVRTAAIKFLNAMEQADGHHARRLRHRSAGRRATPAATMPRLIERIRGRKADGYTALYDALGVYLNGADEQTGQKVLIMYTDGGDTRSTLSHEAT